VGGFPGFKIKQSGKGDHGKSEGGGVVAAKIFLGKEFLQTKLEKNALFGWSRRWGLKTQKKKKKKKKKKKLKKKKKKKKRKRYKPNPPSPKKPLKKKIYTNKHFFKTSKTTSKKRKKKKKNNLGSHSFLKFDCGIL